MFLESFCVCKWLLPGFCVELDLRIAEAGSRCVGPELSSVVFTVILGGYGWKERSDGSGSFCQEVALRNGERYWRILV